jgi:3-hydroxybutyryl-CoA dehydrogenase
MSEPQGSAVVPGSGLAASWPAVSVCVVGAGYMGAGIGQVLAGAGADVVLVDADPARAEARAEATIREAADLERAGLLGAGIASAVAAHLRAAAGVAAGVEGRDLVVEAVPEDVILKQSVLREIESYAPADSVIATNTSAIPIALLAKAIHDRSRFLGMHWFNPPQFVPGIEIIPGPETAPHLTGRLADLLRQLDKIPTVVPDTPGFVCNRLQFALFREAAAMVEEGVAGPEDIDAVVRASFGFRLPLYGPFVVADMAGLDVYAGAFATLEAAFGPRFSCPPSLTAKVAAGELGAKSGRGYTAAGSSWTDQDAIARNRAYQRLGDLTRTVSASTRVDRPNEENR